jgi:peptidoglycan DL-endopeptidase CwlO
MASVWGVAMLASSGCVMKSTYEAALQENIATQAELNNAREEQKVLVRQAKEIELQNADVMREAEAAVAALKQAQDDVEQERQQFAQHIATLKQKVAQATKQQHGLRYQLTVARENAAALQESIDAYQQQFKDGAAASSPLEATVHKPFDPSTIPIPQDLPAVPAVTPPTPSPAPAPTPAPAARPVQPPQPPPDEGFFTSLKNWLFSLWHSVFS